MYVCMYVCMVAAVAVAVHQMGVWDETESLAALSTCFVLPLLGQFPVAS